MTDYQFAGCPARESVWRRGRDDAKSFRNSWYLWIVDVSLGGSLAVLAITLIDDAVIRTVVPVIILSVVPILVFVGSVSLAPLKQRNEARREAILLLKLREPKLTVAAVQGRPLYDVDTDLGKRDLVYSFGIRIKNESDGLVEGCFATVMAMNESTKYSPLIKEYGGFISRPDDFDTGMVNACIPRPLIWPENKLGNRIPPRNEVVVDVLHYMIGNERPVKVRTPATGDMHVLEDEELLFIISIGDEQGLPIYCVCKYVPTSWSSENWSLKYVGTDRPNLNDYQSFKQIQGQSALSTVTGQ